MFCIKNNDIFITKGDYGRFVINLKNRDGSEYTIKDGDRVIFSIKKRREGFYPVVLEKAGTDIEITSKETQGILSGGYEYDIRLERLTGEIVTIIEGKFEIRKAAHS